MGENRYFTILRNIRKTIGFLSKELSSSSPCEGVKGVKGGFETILFFDMYKKEERTIWLALHQLFIFQQICLISQQQLQYHHCSKQQRYQSTYRKQPSHHISSEFGHCCKR